MPYIYMLLAVISEVIATTSLKAADGFTKAVPSALVVVGYGFAFYFLSITLRTLPVGTAYAIWSGCGIILVAIAGWLIYGQKMDLWGVLGMALIIAGVLILNLMSKTSVH
ncbi:DMT family transporter [Pseudooceanicola sp. MF1-13]|uniref:DMT family transporter n=1 Tax=Pseudooceanicola sp. MF1-13 TaxID=3379095 RepID=UPI0038912537